MKMEPIESSETSSFRTQTPGNYPKENMLHKEHGESLKSRTRVGSFVLSDNPKNGFATTGQLVKRLALGTSFSVLKGSCLLEQ
jgi:hypothetical protein